MPIRYYEGVEGAGKSCMMTRDLYLHKLSGGQIFALPGYELYGENKRQVLSNPILPEQILDILRDEKYWRKKVAFAADEVGNFFNHHTWYNKLCDILRAILAQRRKLGVSFNMTGPMIGELPPDIRYMIHEVVHCVDNHTLNHAIPRGHKCIYYKEDMRGLLSNPKHRFSRKKVMLMPPWYRHFDTYSPVDVLNQFITVKFKGRKVVYGADGQPIDNTQGLADEATLNKYVSDYNQRLNQEDPRLPVLKQLIKKVGNTPIESSLVYDVLKARKHGDKMLIGRMLRRLNYTYNAIYKRYEPVEESVSV